MKQPYHSYVERGPAKSTHAARIIYERELLALLRQFVEQHESLLG